MAITTTEFTFLSGGKLVRRDTTEREIRITPDMVQSMASDITVKSMGVAAHEKWGIFNCSIGVDRVIWWTARLPQLNIRAPWVMRDSKWVPDLQDKDTPATVMKWVPPADMHLAFLVPMLFCREGDVRKAGHSYLFAFYTADYSTWRLPLGNLYDECRVCLGEENFHDSTQMRCVAKVLEQFDNAQWNADLWTTKAKTQKLFAFKPHNEGFDQLPTDTHWTNFAAKVGNTVSEKVVL